MKEQIINILKNVHEAKTLIEINDLLGLKTVTEYQSLTKDINELAQYQFDDFKEMLEYIKNELGD